MVKMENVLENSNTEEAELRMYLLSRVQELESHIQDLRRTNDNLNQSRTRAEFFILTKGLEGEYQQYAHQMQEYEYMWYNANQVMRQHQQQQLQQQQTLLNYRKMFPETPPYPPRNN